MIWALAVVCGAAVVPAALRWLRVAQREHYLPGEVSRFSVRWWLTTPLNAAILVMSVSGLVGAWFHPAWGVLPAVAQVGPVGLSIRGVTSPLAWTSRLRRLAVVSGALVAVLFGVGLVTGNGLPIALSVVGLPVIVDVANRLLAPFERASGAEWVDKAAAKLRDVDAEVVAITGSYGKTTTKAYVAHLLSGSKRVVASPASFNNRMGLARAINENLNPGTEIFVAEMGTYGIGEIAELCEWITPKVAAMVAIGPVHLERFKTLETTVAAKSEILDGADVGVICIDHPLLADLADERSNTMDIVRVSATDGITIDGRAVTTAPDGVFGANLAVALGICHALGVELDEVIERIPTLPTSEHRQSITHAQAGFVIVDDTFNSNPAGARSALGALERAAGGGVTAVITPGMVELGSSQREENMSFAAEAASRVDHFVIVGRTNRKALLEGSAKGRASVTVVDDREQAVTWAVANLGEGDAVLYENDLPDHYP